MKVYNELWNLYFGFITIFYLTVVNVQFSCGASKHIVKIPKIAIRLAVTFIFEYILF
jgi:hypothetical protein